MLTCDLGCSPKKRHTEVSSFFGFEGDFALPCSGRSERVFLSIFFFLCCPRTYVLAYSGWFNKHHWTLIVRHCAEC